MPDIIGYDVMGDPIQAGEDVGARMRHAHAKKHGRQLPGIPGQPHVIPSNEMGPVRVMFLPLDTVTLAKSGTGSLTKVTQKPIRCERLLLTTTEVAVTGLTQSNLPLILVTNLALGVDPQLTAFGNFPADGFQNTAVGIGIEGTTLQQGNTATVALLSLDAAATHALSGLIKGSTIY